MLLERALHLAGAAAEHVGFRRLRGQALLELGHAARQALDLAAFLIQFLGGGAQLDALGLAAVFHRLDFFAGRRQPLFERLDLRLVRDDLDLLRVGEARAFVELSQQLGERGLLVGQHALGVVHARRS